MANSRDHHHFHDHSHHEGEHHHHQHNNNGDIGSRLVEEGLRLRGTNRRLGQSHRELYYTDSGNAYTYEVGVYIEVDNVLRNKFTTEADMLTYLDNLIAGINIIYEREVDSHLVIVGVAITTRYDSATGTLGALEIQRNTFAGASWPHADADLVHALLGERLGGGIAYKGVLCNQNYGFGISSGLLGTFDISMPQMMVWDILVTAHEFGHNFDGSHTHDVFAFPGGQIDTCYDDASMSYVTETCAALVDDSASIMSYCHVCPFNLGGLGVDAIAPSMGGERTGTNTWINSPLVLGSVSKDPFQVPKEMYEHVLATHTNKACLAKISTETLSPTETPTPTRAPTFEPTKICPAVSNDDAENAISVIVGASPTPFDLECATAQPNEPSGSNWLEDIVHNSVWYTFVAPASGSVEIETVEGPNGETVDTQLALYVANGMVSDFSTFVEVASDDDGGSSFEFASLVVDEVSPGLTYYVQVDGYQGDAGVAQLEIREQAPATLPPTPSPTKTPTSVLSEVPTIPNTNADPTTAPTIYPPRSRSLYPAATAPSDSKSLRMGMSLLGPANGLQERRQKSVATSLECLPPIQSPVEAATLAPILGCDSNSTTTETTLHEAVNS